ncbi:hypothetical protein VTN77DRAFT_9937 [Rasamsonia byssochlamydoides]|uniref:uncharacterized protein n=1 Tax=Rasamsonia byssochlamydoides TaxID=89139 RepID=UPI003744A174
MFSFSDLPLRLPGLAIIQPDSSISAYADQMRAIGAEGDAIDVINMFLTNPRVEFERSTMVEHERFVVSSGSSSQRPLLSDRHGIDGLSMSIDFTNTVSAVCGEAVSISLFAITNGNDTLRITIPRKVIDATTDNGVLALGNPFSNAVPDSHGTCRIAASDVKSGWRETSNCGLGFMFCILLCDGGVVD